MGREFQKQIAPDEVPVQERFKTAFRKGVLDHMFQNHPSAGRYAFVSRLVEIMRDKGVELNLSDTERGKAKGSGLAELALALWRSEATTAEISAIYNGVLEALAEVATAPARDKREEDQKNRASTSLRFGFNRVMHEVGNLHLPDTNVRHLDAHGKFLIAGDEGFTKKILESVLGDSLPANISVDQLYEALKRDAESSIGRDFTDPQNRQSAQKRALELIQRLRGEIMDMLSE